MTNITEECMLPSKGPGELNTSEITKRPAVHRDLTRTSDHLPLTLKVNASRRGIHINERRTQNGENKKSRTQRIV